MENISDSKLMMGPRLTAAEDDGKTSVFSAPTDGSDSQSAFQRPVNRSVWFDLPAVDLSDAMSFYEGLLGWKYKKMENSPLLNYVMIEVDGMLIGGLRRVASVATPRPKRNHPPPSESLAAGPILYFTVDKLAAKVARAKELGAEIVGESVELGNGRGCYQWIRDREGHLIGLWGPQ